MTNFVLVLLGIGSVALLIKVVLQWLENRAMRARLDLIQAVVNNEQMWPSRLFGGWGTRIYNTQATNDAPPIVANAESSTLFEKFMAIIFLLTIAGAILSRLS